MEFPDGEALAERLRRHGLTRGALASVDVRHRHAVRRRSVKPALTSNRAVPMSHDRLTHPHLLVRAARGEAVERPPVWAMRQAGRWDPEFNRVRAGLSFYEFSENVELAAEASLLPRRFGVDAIILFYDITTLPVAMGLPFALRPAQGPVPDRPDPHAGRRASGWTREPDPERFDHIRELLKPVQGRAARRVAGDRLRRGAVHRGDLLHRHRQGPGAPRAASPPSSRRSGTRCSTG